MRRTAFSSLLLGVFVSAIACGAGPASAATLELRVVEAQSLSASGSLSEVPRGPLARLFYRSTGDAVDRVVVDLEVVDGSAKAYLVRAPTGTSAGGGCTPIQSGRWRCAIPSGASPVGPSIGLGDGSDSVSISGVLHPGALLWAGRGRDRLSGGGRLVGGPGRDRLHAVSERRVRMEGGGGPDHIVGAEGSDDIGGGGGADFIVPGRGRDSVEAGVGNDRIVAWKDGGDYVGCGHGADVARVDGVDLVGPPYAGGPADARCERVVRSTPARALPEGVYEEDAGAPTWIDVHCPWDLPLGCIAKATLSIPGGRTLGSRRLRIPPGDIRSARFYSPSEHALALLERRGAKATVITYVPHNKPRQAVAVFPFSVYRGEG